MGNREVWGTGKDGGPGRMGFPDLVVELYPVLDSIMAFAVDCVSVSFQVTKSKYPIALRPEVFQFNIFVQDEVGLFHRLRCSPHSVQKNHKFFSSTKNIRYHFDNLIKTTMSGLS